MHRTDVFVEFQLLNHDGSPSEPFPDRRPRRVTTCALAADGDSTCVFQDQLALLLPDQYTQGGGLLSITVYDDDLKAADDKLGMSTVPLIFTPENWPDDVCNLDQHVLTGQRSLAGRTLPGPRVMKSSRRSVHLSHATSALHVLTPNSTFLKTPRGVLAQMIFRIWPSASR